MKACSKCGITKPLDDYHKMVNGPDGRRPNCKVCVLSAAKIYTARNPTRNRDYLRANRERLLPMYREWALRQQQKDPMWTRLRGAVARAQQRGLPAEKFTGSDLLRYWRENGIDPDRCFYTGEPLDDFWELDHAHSLGKEDSPGHVLSNVVPAQRSVNRSKGRRSAEEYRRLACEFSAD